MEIKVKEFKEVANKILLAADLDKTAANLEIYAKGTSLYLNVTNRAEYYVSVKFNLEQEADFRAVVDAALFLNLISGITTDTFDLSVDQTVVKVKAGKSNYKLAMIYDNDKLMDLPVIAIGNKTVEMSISNDILKSILNVNSKELLKVKNLDVSELQRLYYIDENGCFTFTTGACLNSFTLEKPVKMLLTDEIVKLFKLFDEDVLFSLGYDQLPNSIVQTKATFETANVYVAAILPKDDSLLSTVQGPCMATKTYINTTYPNHLVLSVNALNAAISRLMLFTKNSIEHTNMLRVPATVVLTSGEMSITDRLGNTEVVVVENESYVEEGYTMVVNLADLKLVLDSCKDEHITLNCGNHKSIIIARGNINNLIPEVQQ